MIYDILSILTAIFTPILMIILMLRYTYLKKHSDKKFIHLLVFMFYALLFFGFGVVGILNAAKNNFNDDGIIFFVFLQLPFIVIAIVYNIMNIKYKKRLSVNERDIQNSEWK